MTRLVVLALLFAIAGCEDSPSTRWVRVARWDIPCARVVVDDVPCVLCRNETLIGGELVLSCGWSKP